MGLPTDNVDWPAWCEDMLRKRILRKGSEKLQRISKEKGRARFNCDVASVMSVDADNLSSSEKTCDVIGEEFENISAEVPVLR